MFGNPETTSGGNALKFYASVRLDIRRIGAIKDKDDIIGNQTRVKVVKNKVDRRVEEMVFEKIKEYYPDDNFLGEESGHEINTSETTWILDPIDGTTNFIHGYPQYCISLACVVNGQTQHAVIIDPTRREEFSASRGKGAELNGERIRVSSRNGLKDSLIGNTSHLNDSQDYTFENIATFRALYKHNSFKYLYYQ